MAFTVNEQWLHTQYFDPLMEQVEKIGGTLGGLSIAVSDDEGRVVTKASPVEPDGSGDLHTQFSLAVHGSGARQVDTVAPLAGARVDGARPVDARSDAARHAAGRRAGCSS